MNVTGTTALGTTPRLLANRFQVALPSTTPSGSPMTMPTTARVVARQATEAMTWPFTNPRAFKRPTSRRRRATLTTSRCVRVAAPNTASMVPKMRGKLTASPKLTSDVGVIGTVAIDGQASPRHLGPVFRPDAVRPSESACASGVVVAPRPG